MRSIKKVVSHLSEIISNAYKCQIEDFPNVYPNENSTRKKKQFLIFQYIAYFKDSKDTTIDTKNAICVN